MATNRTQPTAADPHARIAALADPARRADCAVLMEMMERITAAPARMWGPSIVGFGTYHYTYESGREGDFMQAGFAARKRELVVYLIGTFAEQAELLTRLGKHRMGKSCLYIKRLADVDHDVLEELITRSVAAVRRTHPSDPAG